MRNINLISVTPGSFKIGSNSEKLAERSGTAKQRCFRVIGAVVGCRGCSATFRYVPLRQFGFFAYLAWFLGCRRCSATFRYVPARAKALFQRNLMGKKLIEGRHVERRG
jgi:hypothetical protein